MAIVSRDELDGTMMTEVTKGQCMLPECRNRIESHPVPLVEVSLECPANEVR